MEKETKKGKLIIFSAPSGAGKTTIVKQVLKSGFPFEFSVSATSRAPRKGETEGRDYYFLSPEDFRKKIDEGAFLEWEEVYPNQYYGTLSSEVERITDKGNNVLFDVDVVGGLNIKKKFGDSALALFIMPPSLKELEKRLRNRNTENSESLEKRLAKAEKELSFAPQFDKVVVNDNLEKAVVETIELIENFLKNE